MKIIGLTRIRNEAEIIQDTLDHMAGFCSNILVYDDASTDNTVNVCESHYSNPTIIKNVHWDKNREIAETYDRDYLLKAAQRVFFDADWFVYMDADERIEFDFKKLKTIPADVNGIRMKLFDYYITPEDIDKPYTERQWIGPEYRNILMAFRNIPGGLKYNRPDQRSPIVPEKIITDGYVKHYGKAVSVQQWEDTCEYYSTWFPKYAAKWEDRKGKAVHTKSDFGRDLITWEEKDKKGIKLY